MQKLEVSLQKDPDYLWNRPCLVNKVDGELIVYAGNQRVRAAKKLGWKEIPCIVEEDLSQDVIRNRIIKDNKQYGEFDHDILSADYEMEELIEAGFLEEELLGKHVEEVEPDNLTDEDSEKAPTIKITFKKVEHLQAAENKISEIVDRFEGAYYSISAGEL